jgi:hypothetical protein
MGKATATKPALTSSGSETKASKVTTAPRKPRVQAVQNVQTVQVVESVAGSENRLDPDVLAQEIVEDLGAALEQFRKIATDMSGERVSLQET